MWRDVARQTKGWLSDAEGDQLHNLGLAADPRLPLVELGTYCGKSTCYLGAAAKQIGTVLFTVDHHRGSPEMAPGQDCHDPDVLDADGRHDTLPHLRTTLAAADLEGTVFPVVGPSATVGKYWGTRVSVVFIDAGHDGASVLADAEAWAPHADVVAFHDATIPDIGAVAEEMIATGWVDRGWVGCMRVVGR